MKTKQETDKKVIALIKMAEKILETATAGHQKHYINEKMFHDFRISSLSFLAVVFSEKSPFYKEFEKEVTTPTPIRTERGLGILTSVQRELQGDWLTSVRGEIFNSMERGMIQNCQNQLKNGQKLSAIILASGILDNHLRSLCVDKGVNTSKDVAGEQVDCSTIQLNSRAYKKNVYDRKFNKNIFSWIEIQQKADCDGVSEIKDEQVENMLKGIIELIVKFPCTPVE
ncbi:MAG: hypothetical protein OCC45_12585 [Desulfotalea sp.]